MTATAGSEEAARVQRALIAHLRQEFLAPAAAIVGYVDILIEDARRLALDGYLPDLEKINSAGHALQALLQSVLGRSEATEIFDQSKLRHDLRTPINAIKGYGEMLVEDASDGGHESLLADLTKLLAEADGVLKLIDALVDFRGDAAGSGAKPPTGMGGLTEAVQAIKAVSVVAAGRKVQGRILIVDDNASNRDLLSRQLTRAGHTIAEADGGLAALARVGEAPFDLILLDMMMPDISGYEVLCRLKADTTTADIPVIMISAMDDLESVMRCVEAGAVDYLLKPFEPTLLHARIGSSVENKILKDREKIMVEELRREKQRSEDLLLSILPRPIVDRINAGETMIADEVREVSILFADIVGFTQAASRQTASQLVEFLNSIFTAFDALSLRFGGEKIKTIGDAYMVAFGLPDPRPDHAEMAARQGLAMLEAMTRFRGVEGVQVNLRVGIHTGSAVAGVIGQRKFSFDIWGNTVNLASRMESFGAPGRVHVSEAVAQALAGKFAMVDRGTIEVKGAGMMRTFFIDNPV